MSTQPELRDVLLEGQRALLRPLVPDDADRAFEMLAGRREILDWLEWSGPAERADLDPLFSSWRQGGDEGRDYHLAILDRSSGPDGVFAGSIDIRFRGHPGCGDLGFWLDPEHWGRGLASDAVSLMTWLCFEHLQATLLSARVFVGNEASRRVLTKSGFRQDHQSKTLINGVVREQWHLSLTRSDYSAATRPRPRAARVQAEPRDIGERRTSE